MISARGGDSLLLRSLPAHDRGTWAHWHSTTGHPGARSTRRVREYSLDGGPGPCKSPAHRGHVPTRRRGRLERLLQNSIEATRPMIMPCSTSIKTTPEKASTPNQNSTGDMRGGILYSLRELRMCQRAWMISAPSTASGSVVNKGVRKSRVITVAPR